MRSKATSGYVPTARQALLAVLPSEEDRTALATILAHLPWKIRFVRTLRQIPTALQTVPAVVISECILSDGHCWKDLLLELQKMESPPPLIVVDRLADEHLWAEVLNLGGHDLLTKPFDAREVLHAVNTAHHRFKDSVGRKTAKAVRNNSMRGVTSRASAAG